MQPMQLTIASSTGGVWLALMLHFAVGLLALVSGFVALIATKGSPWHRRSGALFVLAMLALGLSAALIALLAGKSSSVVGGLFAAYLVLTAYATVQPHPIFHSRAWVLGLALLGSAIALSEAALAREALLSPKGTLDGTPAGMIAFIAMVAVCAAIGDLKLLRVPGGIHGVQRLARHLWRMCFALFIASGSFFLGQIKFLPEAMRSIPVLVALAITPLVALVYWMWRVRVRRKMEGLHVRTPARSSA